MSNAQWVVHKFGGTSVANAERYRAVHEIMLAEPGARKGIVVSAMSKVTDALIELVDLAKARNATYVAKLDALRQRHLDTARELLSPAAFEPMAKVFEADAQDIADVLRAVWLGRSYAELTLELVAGYGEVWSAQILDAYLRSKGLASSWLDAREVLIVRPAEIGPIVDWEVSKSRTRKALETRGGDWLVVTGYVASTPEGAPTTLKRNGSDFSGAIFGSLLDAETVTIWTDVDGVLTADPRRVPEAVVLDEMSYDEAMELAYFGAKVLHPRTMQPVVERGIPTWIRNTFNPKHPGTKIHRLEPSTHAASIERAVKGFSTVDNIALVNVEGTGMVGVPGVAQRLFGALREVGVSVILISQASSEHSVCFAVPEAQSELAVTTVQRAFDAEIGAGAIQTVERVVGCSILAAVGDEMARTPGVAAAFFGALGRARVNVRAIAQGSSERNISAVIDRADSTRALRAVHAGFYLSNQAVSVGIVGPGLVGRALLAQLAAQAPVLRDKFHIDVRVRAVIDSKRMVLDERGLAPGEVAKSMAAGVPADFEAFAKHMEPGHWPHSVVIDCTASDAIADRYASLLARGIHVVTPNKKAGAGPVARYREIQSLVRETRRQFLYEATVGAGLPVISTLRDLVRTGDRVERIEGILSGTLSYVFHRFDGRVPFSTIVREAKQLGYTEPDPRDDLSGTDVARKLVILAREMGLSLELSDVAIENLVPESLRAMPPAEFMERLVDNDASMESRRATASAKGEVLRYVGVVEASGTPRVELRAYPTTHPFAGLAASDNIIAFTTARYRTNPLIVQGPGAGPDVTAAGVFADLLRLVSA